MDAGQIATLAIVAGLAVEKILIHLDCYNGVRRLHCNMSSQQSGLTELSEL